MGCAPRDILYAFYATDETGPWRRAGTVLPGSTARPLGAETAVGGVRRRGKRRGRGEFRGAWVQADQADVCEPYDVSKGGGSVRERGRERSCGKKRQAYGCMHHDPYALLRESWRYRRLFVTGVDVARCVRIVRCPSAREKGVYVSDEVSGVAERRDAQI